LVRSKDSRATPGATAKAAPQDPRKAIRAVAKQQMLNLLITELLIGFWYIISAAVNMLAVSAPDGKCIIYSI
jgi:hypothetical protein